MPKLILRCNYLKNAPPSHLSNYMHYISTREGVEKVSDSTAKLPATVRQKELIQDILTKIPDADRMHEYYDYTQKPTRENASEFITQALENNIDLIAKKKNYMDYLGNRPGVEKIGTHGLFSNEGEPVVLSRVMEEVANHEGVVWTNVISLRREDAERLGYDSVSQWQALLRSRVQLLCESYKIDSRNLKWYGAFHNESHHPHVHLVVYSLKPSEGHLTKQGIETMRSTFAHDIFRQEFMSIYEKKTQHREQMKEQTKKSLLFLLQQLQNGVCHNPEIAQQMQLLSKRLMRTKGKKVYGYLKADVKAIVDRIVDELAKEEKVAECYAKWLESKNEILHYYKDSTPKPPPLSKQKELKSIKNMVIKEAVRFGEGYLYMEESEEVIAPEAGLPEEDMISHVPDIWDEGMPLEEAERMEEPQNRVASYYAEWTDTYKEARTYLYGTIDTEPDAEAAYETMKEEAEKGNAYAMHDMGKIYHQGIFVKAEISMAEQWYQKALGAMQAVEKKKEQAYLEYRIAKMYQYGLGTEEDLSKAAEWFSLAAKKEQKHALYSLGMLYLQGKGVEQDAQKGCSLLLKSHKKGNPYASYELGKLHESGVGTSKSREIAEKYYRLAFLGFLGLEKKSKDDTWWYRIGCMYLHGIGTEADEKMAAAYLLKAQEYGNPHAAYQLAKMYIRQEEQKEKEGEEIDYEKIKKAVAWLTQAAKQKNPFADYALGKLYGEGILIAKDMEKTFFHLHRAADAGNAYAQYRLGRWYLTLEWQNTEKAVEYLRMAAGQNHDNAAYQLGKLYLAGEELPKDVDRAIWYLEQAASAGNQYAEYVLGKLYLIGKDVPQDKEKAYDYLQLAAEQGNVYAAFLLEHWHDMSHPDLFFMATRLMHHLQSVFVDDVSCRRRGKRGGIDQKLARKIKAKKIAQGHAEDDREELVQT